MTGCWEQSPGIGVRHSECADPLAIPGASGEARFPLGKKSGDPPLQVGLRVQTSKAAAWDFTTVMLLLSLGRWGHV